MSAQISHKKSIARNAIIRHLYFHKLLSCADISELIEKSLPLTTRYINEMLEEGSIVEKGLALSTGGRRPQMYALAPDSFYILAVAMDQFDTRMVLVNESNQIVGEISRKPLPLAGNENAAIDLVSNIRHFIEGSGKPANKIIGIGIGMPGFIDTKKGINYTFLPVKEKSLVELIEQSISIPVRIDNDSSLIALAELKWGAAQGRKNVMVVNIGWGVGLGIISNGNLFRGNEGFAGEFSHIPLFDNNKLCSCGKHGCLETETSLVVVIEKIKKGLKDGRISLLRDLPDEELAQSIKAIIEAAQKGDTFSIEVLSEAAYNIGRGVSILIHLLNPELIIISGIGSLAGKLWIAPIQQAINAYCIPKISENVDLKLSTLGYDAELIGAAALVMENPLKIRGKEKSKTADRITAL
ncbi:MAG: ROK family protein [Niabella sp.]